MPEKTLITPNNLPNNNSSTQITEFTNKIEQLNTHIINLEKSNNVLSTQNQEYKISLTNFQKTITELEKSNVCITFQKH